MEECIRLEPESWACKSLMSMYELGDKLGSGAYGFVYSATRLSDSKPFALKKMENILDQSQMGFPITTVREIQILQRIQHPNILKIRDVVFQIPFKSKAPPNVYLCLDLMTTDLGRVIKSEKLAFSVPRIRSILRQILEGIKFLHENNIVHRDLKPSNVLLLNRVAKIADFGLAKKMTKYMTTKVVTMWYRAPQLLLGIKTYTENVDIWSIGCILAQMLLTRPLFYDQKNEKQLIQFIFKLVGTPSANGWENDLKGSQVYEELRPSFYQTSQVVNYLRERIQSKQDLDILLDLAEKMLRLNPNSRFSARQCLQHQFFNCQIDEVDLYEFKSQLDSTFKHQAFNIIDANSKRIKF